MLAYWSYSVQTAVTWADEFYYHEIHTQIRFLAIMQIELEQMRRRNTDLQNQHNKVNYCGDKYSYPWNG